MSNQGSVLLLGSGYTLSRLANDLPKESLILTSTKLEKVEAFRSQGFVAEQVDVKDRGSLNSLFSTHPEIAHLLEESSKIIANKARIIQKQITTPDKGEFLIAAIKTSLNLSIMSSLSK